MSTPDRDGRARREGRVLGALLLALLFAAAGAAAGVRWRDEITARVKLPWLTRGAPEAGGDEAASTQLYTCGMHPQVIQQGPGTCPICGMQLTPVAATPSGPTPSAAGGGSTVFIDPAVVQNMGVRVATVVEAPLRRELRFFGMLEEPEPGHVDVNLRVDGWIEKLHANQDGMSVQQGDPLFELYSPELHVAIEELIAGAKDATARVLFDAARRKLLLWGVDEAQVDGFAELEAAPRTVVFKSPMSGHVTKKMVYEGAAVTAGQLVLRVASRSRMWIELQVQENDLSWLSLGQRVTATVDAAPGAVFAGEIVFFHPHLDMMTRTALARIELDNESLVLREGMYATAEVEVETAPSALQVPREAVIDTGVRQIVFVALADGHFEPRKVRMGLPGDDGMVQVLEGLAPGESVVTSGQFLLDAESRIREAVQKYLAQRGPAAPAPIDGSAGWRAGVDGVVAAYLEAARALGQPGEESVELDATRLAEAAKELAARAAGDEATALAERFSQAVDALRDAPSARRRETFKAVSEAAVELATRTPPSRAVAARLHVLHCPMAESRWLQDHDAVENPFYGRAMKACGTVERAIEGVDR